MIQVKMALRVQGTRFDPAEASRRVGIAFTTSYSPGSVASCGRYRGQHLPYGFGELVSASVAATFDEEDRFLHDVEALVPAAVEAGAERLVLHLDVGVRQQCNLELGQSFLRRVAAAGLDLTISCFEVE